MTVRADVGAPTATMRSDVRARFMRPLQRSRPVARQRSSTRSVTDLGRQQTNVALRRQLREERGTGATGRRSRTLARCQVAKEEAVGRRRKLERRTENRSRRPDAPLGSASVVLAKTPRTLASKMNRRQTRRPCPLRLPRSSSCLGPAPSPARTPRASLSSRRGSRSGELRMSAPLSRRMWRC